MFAVVEKIRSTLWHAQPETLYSKVVVISLRWISNEVYDQSESRTMSLQVL